MEPITFHAIGVIHTPHTDPTKTPIQPAYAEDIEGHAEVFDEYQDGLRDLDGFSHVYLIYHLHRAGPPRLTVTPFLEDVSHGVFATRAPNRPNAIGLSLVRLTRVVGNTIHFEGADMLDGTPLLDIKPYAARFEPAVAGDVRFGWLDGVDEATAQRRGRRSD
jgi:tRNA-Thr(GGU) m(6)t(6)A37 methyltransferase TsaA